MTEISLVVLVSVATLVGTTEGWFAGGIVNDRSSKGSNVWTSNYKGELKLSQPSTEDGGNENVDMRWEAMLNDLPVTNEKKGGIHALRSIEDVRSKNSKSDVNIGASPIKPTSPVKVEDILRRDLMDVDSDNVLEVGDEKGSDEEDSIFLDAETYVQYSIVGSGTGLVGSIDGYETSLPPLLSANDLLEFTIPPDAPYGMSGNEPNFDDLRRVKRARDKRRQPTREEEKKIFYDIFKDEQVYLNQTSEIFRQGLTNKTAAEEATKIRRGSAYQKALRKEINKLEIQIVEFEQMMIGENARKRNDRLHNEDELVAVEVKSKSEQNLHSGLSDEGQERRVQDEEVDQLPWEYLEEDQPDEWLTVEDPSTGRSFSWSSITEEMKVDKDS